jgi:hypothetical protein
LQNLELARLELQRATELAGQAPTQQQGSSGGFSLNLRMFDVAVALWRIRVAREVADHIQVQSSYNQSAGWPDMLHVHHTDG